MHAQWFLMIRTHGSAGQLESAGTCCMLDMKAANGKFHPLCQFFYFYSIESLPEEALSPEDVPLAHI